MFSEPTINDFLDNVKWHLAKAADRAGRAVASTQGLLASKGGLNSGRAIIMILDAVRTEFDAAIETVFGELKRRSIGLNSTGEIFARQPCPVWKILRSR